MTPPPRRPSPLVTEPVGPTLVRLSAPVALGIGALLLFNAVDTLYVGRLGARELAAMSFTFPVSFSVLSLSIGIGMGVTSVVSRAIGEGDVTRVRRLTTDSLILALVLTALVTPLGILLTRPVFGVLGASTALMPLIEEYMVPWFLGAGLMVVSNMANAALRANGDTRTPSTGMIAGGVLNAILDPLFIFGLGPSPAFGLAGAAYATVVSWSLIFGISLWAIHVRDRQIQLALPTVQQLRDSSRAVMRIGFPAAVTNVLVPVGSGVVTRLAAQHGAFAVAAYGIGTRIELLAQVGVFALGTAMNPLAGQNYGARRVDRLRLAIRSGFLYSIAWGASMALLLGVTAPGLASIFNEDPRVIEIATRYLRTVPVSYGFVGTAVVVASMFNAIDRPIKSATVVLVRIFCLAIPLSLLGNHLAALPGLFLGLALGNLTIGWVSLLMARRELDALEEGWGDTGAIPEAS